MENLNKKELVSISGGHDGAAYEVGVAVGNILEVGLAVFGSGKLLKWAKRIF